MRRAICFFVFVFCGINTPPLSASLFENFSWDSLSDQKIEACFYSEEFQQLSLNYTFDQKNYEMRLIFNPQHEEIQLRSGKRSMMQFYYGVFIRDRIPEMLNDHLNELIGNVLGDVGGGYWSIASTFNGEEMIDLFDGARAFQNVEKSPTEEYDEQIAEVFNASTFTQVTIDYVWEGKTYSVHVAYNPERAYLWSEALAHPVSWPLAITTGDLSCPFSLTDHLKSILPESLLRDNESVVDNYSFEALADLHPVTVSDTIENPILDEQIRKVFSSSKLEKLNLHYLLNDQWFRVLLIHNPEGKTLKSTLSNETSWNRKIGIFIDNKGPNELASHLKNLSAPTWMDTLWYGIAVENGTYVTDKSFSWYTFMMNASD